MTPPPRSPAPLLHVPATGLESARVRAGITTRIGFPSAVSEDADSPDRAQARQILARALNVAEDALSWVRQVHGATLLEADRRGLLGEADALATADPERMLLITVADCVPVLLWEPGTGRHAALHAGWRGVVTGVVGAGLTWFTNQGTELSRLRVWLGPHIGPDHFEVGPEVATRFDATHVIATPTEGANPHVDLAAAIRAELVESGVGPQHITQSPYCTYTDRDLFWSYRRDGGICGRHIAFLRG